ncbi:MAG TPA: hypothetical protein VF489_07295 [Sphingobium sp.]
MSAGDGDPWDSWALERRGELKLGRDGKTPAPDNRQPMINGAPVSEQSHEYVMPQNPMKTAGPAKLKRVAK